MIGRVCRQRCKIISFLYSTTVHDMKRGECRKRFSRVIIVVEPSWHASTISWQITTRHPRNSLVEVPRFDAPKPSLRIINNL